MNTIDFKIIKPHDIDLIELVADWYWKEWHIPQETIIKRLCSFPEEGTPFHVIMLLDQLPIGAGGIYHYVSLMDKMPHLHAFQPWLVLVYTCEEHRRKGYGALLCQKIDDLAQERGIHEIFLFTHTAEPLYNRLGWKLIERHEIADKNIAVMQKTLHPLIHTNESKNS